MSRYNETVQTLGHSGDQFDRLLSEQRARDAAARKSLSCSECGQPINTRDQYIIAFKDDKPTAALHALTSADQNWSTCSEAWLNRHFRDGSWNRTHLVTGG
jgi:predicted kinase